MPEETEKKVKPKKKKFRGFLHSLFLFVSVFVFALGIIFFLAKSYTPDVDVAIGNNESMTLGEDDMNVEIKSVDERLKWIQMEDEMPSVSVRNPNNDIDVNNFGLGYEGVDEENANDKNAKKDEKVTPPPKPSISEIINSKSDFRMQDTPPKQVIPLPIKPQLNINEKKEEPEAAPVMPSVTRVYLGQYQTLEEAMSVQEKVSKDISGTAPFIKAVNDSYMVQLGSFTDKTKADNFVNTLKEKGYNPKVSTNN